jgi:hypothetical protein
MADRTLRARTLRARFERRLLGMLMTAVALVLDRRLRRLQR